MPPVLGPVSPSPTRLWSCAEPNGTMVLPSVSAKKLASSPSRNSSITTSAPALAEPPANISSIAASASARVVGDRHALARGEPVGLDHHRHAEAGRAPPVASASDGDACIGGGRDARAVAQRLGEALAAFELRGAAGSARTPRCRRRAARRRGRRPAAPRGRSRPGRCVLPRRTSQPPLDRPHRARPARHARRSPDCRARRRACSQIGDCASFQASACSRPPEPSSRTFMADPFPSTLPMTSAGQPLVAKERRATTPRRCRSPNCRGALKRTVEDRFGYVRVRGELSGVKRAASGHCYCCLKDDDARDRRRDVEQRGAAAAVPPRGRHRGDRHRQAHHLSRPLEIPDRDRPDGAGGRGRADGAARQEQGAAGRRGAVRRRPASAACPSCRA